MIWIFNVIKSSQSRYGAREERRYASKVRLLKLRRRVWRQDERS